MSKKSQNPSSVTERDQQRSPIGVRTSRTAALIPSDPIKYSSTRKLDRHSRVSVEVQQKYSFILKGAAVASMLRSSGPKDSLILIRCKNIASHKGYIVRFPSFHEIPEDMDHEMLL